ncbi:hypothetical protein PO909_011484 [Leuciscus waleckii]
MPRGFLVKRSKRASSASYKVRAQEEKEPRKEDLPSQTANASVLDVTDSYSPIKPISTEFLDRCLSSPAMAESFPLATPVSSIERLLMNHSDMKFGTPVPSSVPTYPAFHQCVKRAFMDTERKSKAPKKPKVIRKLNFEDEVTTSPVLGLKIKKEIPESKLNQSGRKKPLGEFICQLCKEEYPDPFSLAQHKCSRIVRVEYRCPECDKVFSCPANLASHRRWHKPRGLSTGDAKKSPLEPRNHEKTSVEGKENASKMSGNNHKKFRREIRDKHRLWHVQIFSCKHCPSTFFSSPGLTRHINKSHPTENRQVMLLQMAVRPGC